MLSAIYAPAADQPVPGTHTLLVMPFENHSKAPGLEWISEAFPEVLSQRMASQQSLRHQPRGPHLRLRPRRHTGGGAALARDDLSVAEQMDADYVVLGDYDFDGNTFSAQLNCWT